jgi:uncharacterized protein
VQTTSLEDKVAFLQHPDAFPDAPERVDVIETHFAWVFLSRLYVYKLKKPIKFHGFDFTTLEARRENCELEIALNRRLAEPVYIGVVPLGRRGSTLLLEADATAVEWLVKMHRLPSDRTLEHVALHGRVEDTDLSALIEKLARFYAATTRASWDGLAYRTALTRRLERYTAELAASDAALDRGCLERIVENGHRFLHDHTTLFDARIAEGRVVDAHGDLRPEHVFLSSEPQIIDCLEFSAELRLLDTLEEISFLALECERLGRAHLGRHIEALYRERCADDAVGALADFYRSQRAIVRALLCAWHLHDGLPNDVDGQWRARATWYLDAAVAAIGAGTGPRRSLTTAG